MAFSANKKDVVRARMQLVENMFNVLLPEASKRHGRRIDQSAMLYDMDGRWRHAVRHGRLMAPCCTTWTVGGTMLYDMDGRWHHAAVA